VVESGLALNPHPNPLPEYRARGYYGVLGEGREGVPGEGEERRSR